MTEYAFLNGQILPVAEANVNITDLAILRGYGVFDFFRAIEGKPIFIEDHLDRFAASTQKMNLSLPYSRDVLRDNILELVKLNTHKLLGIRLLCTGGYSEDGYTPADTPNVMMLAKPFSMPSPDKKVKLMLAEHVREMADIKSINYAKPITLLPRMKAVGADDVLYHSGGIVSESSRSNIFIVKNEQVLTPISNILYGITRKNIINVAKKYFDIVERDFTLEELLNADEVFMTGSTKRAASVAQVDNKIYVKYSVAEKINQLLLDLEQS
ncbi:MAG: branched-chain amino acid aminotransferase [Saprospiraceae bacterium]|nr:branched-chain amino acid aminotransferase [Saprospiraceae bacterium]